ncbi:SDR family NAD(P)-dependent oxidoreductase [Biomphalaria pfeifferi]|uniref:SDR family NAD(P)-dependent oxidoreductase n=1 Tax=Biomphalaria pfeifferi TaxID=112525 RepID=A0AAD8AQI7_BIOPF|nr:SDR family NAD(P)-dependent oxidoreductase [Biomphalaria pfeifferi]
MNILNSLRPCAISAMNRGMANWTICLMKFCRIAPKEKSLFAAKMFFTAKLVKAEHSVFESKQNSANGLKTKYRPDGTYLIAGGFGGLGVATAAHLIAEGAGNIILIGRHQPEEAAQQEIEKLRENGAQISAVIADISDLAAITSALAEIEIKFPPIKGIIQAAGVLSDSVIDNLDASRLRQVLLPKVGGTWNLHYLTRDAELDFFVFYSSVAAMLGSPGQAAHAAANSFMDALAFHRRRSNLTALSVNWGPWKDAGKASNNSLSKALTERGLDGISSADAFDIFDELIAAEATHIGIFSLKPQKWLEYYPHLKDSGYLSELDPKFKETLTEVKSGKSLMDDLLAVLPRERRNMLIKTIKYQAAKVLGMNIDKLDSKIPLQNYGLDSLRALEFRNALEKLTQRKISAVVCWKYPTVEQLGGFLAQLLEVETETSQAEAPKAGNKRSEGNFNDIRSLSEAETLDLLQKKLEALK